MADSDYPSDPVNAPVVYANLFRQEAVDAASTRYGAPVQPMGLAGWGLTAFLLLLLVAITIFLAVGHYTRKETVQGILQPTTGAARIAPLVPGTISKVHVLEGQLVRAGEPILTLSTDAAVSGASGEDPAYLSTIIEQGAARERAAIDAQTVAQAAISARTLEDLVVRRESLEEDQVQLQTSLSLQYERVRLAEETWQAGQALHTRELFSTLQLRQREEALISAKQGVEAIRRDMRRNAGQLSQIAAEAGRLRAQLRESVAQKAQIEAQLDQRDASRRADRAVLLVAPSSGRIVGLQAREGAPVQPGRALAIVLADGAQLQAELWAPSRAVGFLKPGNAVRIMYDAFPYQKFGVGAGRVLSVAGAPTAPEDLPPALEAREAMYRVIVNVDKATIRGYDRQWALTPGMRLSADLVLDERSLWEWLLDPVIAVQRRNQ